MEIITSPTIETPERRAKLTEYAQALDEHLHAPPRGYVMGKTTLRNALMARYRCSALAAEEIVDELERTRFIRFEAPEPEAPRHWTIHPDKARQAALHVSLAPQPEVTRC